jgi:hypothetical protein
MLTTLESLARDGSRNRRLTVTRSGGSEIKSAPSAAGRVDEA